MPSFCPGPREAAEPISRIPYQSPSLLVASAHYEHPRFRLELMTRVRSDSVWGNCNTRKIFEQRHISERIAWSDDGYVNRSGDLVMTIGSLTPIQRATAMKEGFAADKVRTLIASHLGVDVERVTDDAHFADDFGADWLDRLELMIAIEDEFPGVEIRDDEADQIEVVGDLIRHIETVDHERAGAATGHRRSAAPVIRKFFGRRSGRAVWNPPSKRLQASAARISDRGEYQR
jgi:acyl carrier protein